MVRSKYRGLRGRTWQGHRDLLLPLDLISDPRVAGSSSRSTRRVVHYGRVVLWSVEAGPARKPGYICTMPSCRIVHALPGEIAIVGWIHEGEEWREALDQKKKKKAVETWTFGCFPWVIVGAGCVCASYHGPAHQRNCRNTTRTSKPHPTPPVPNIQYLVPLLLYHASRFGRA